MLTPEERHLLPNEDANWSDQYCHELFSPFNFQVHA